MAISAHHPPEVNMKLYLRRTAHLNLCLSSNKLADRVVEVIGDELINPNRVVFEDSPGDGILTSRLLEHGTHRLRVFEHNKKRLACLSELKSKYGDRLEIVDKRILDIADGMYKMRGLERADMLRDCFDDIQVQENWSNLHKSDRPVADCSIQFISALAPAMAREFVSFLTYALVRYDSFFCTGPTEFFLFLPLCTFKEILRPPSSGNLRLYTSFTIMFNSLFDMADIDLYATDLDGVEKGNVANRALTIVPHHHFSYTSGRPFNTSDKFVFVRIKPKPISNSMDAEFMINYWAFVKQSYIKRTNYAIRYYEKHFPGCAIDLIGLGISYYKTFGDLTSEEVFRIFNHLYRTPQYNTSIFRELS